MGQILNSTLRALSSFYARGIGHRILMCSLSHHHLPHQDAIIHRPEHSKFKFEWLGLTLHLSSTPEERNLLFSRKKRLNISYVLSLRHIREAP
jgi:hypothetical protein